MQTLNSSRFKSHLIETKYFINLVLVYTLKSIVVGLFPWCIPKHNVKYEKDDVTYLPQSSLPVECCTLSLFRGEINPPPTTPPTRRPLPSNLSPPVSLNQSLAIIDPGNGTVQYVTLTVGGERRALYFQNIIIFKS